jgi:hypothetical protein
MESQFDCRRVQGTLRSVKVPAAAGRIAFEAGVCASSQCSAREGREASVPEFTPFLDGCVEQSRACAVGFDQGLSCRVEHIAIEVSAKECKGMGALSLSERGGEEGAGKVEQYKFATVRLQDVARMKIRSSKAGVVSASEKFACSLSYE